MRTAVAEVTADCPHVAARGSDLSVHSPRGSCPIGPPRSLGQQPQQRVVSASIAFRAAAALPSMREFGVGDAFELFQPAASRPGP